MTATPIRIASLAALKRAIVPGCRIYVVAHWQERLIGTWRTPNRIQGNAFTYTTLNAEGVAFESWCRHPTKRADVRFNDDGTVTYFPADERSWTLAFYPPE